MEGSDVNGWFELHSTSILPRIIGKKKKKGKRQKGRKRRDPKGNNDIGISFLEFHVKFWFLCYTLL